MNDHTRRGGRALLFATVLALAPGLAFAADSGPMATVHAMLDAFNRNDGTAAAATNTDDVSILDEIPPHAWHGPGAFQAWLGDFVKDSAATGQTDVKTRFVRTVRSQIDGDSAYAVIQVNLTYRQHGRRMIEPAQIAFSLHQDAGAWKIDSWAWAGGVAHRIEAAKPMPAAPAPVAAKPKT